MLPTEVASPRVKQSRTKILKGVLTMKYISENLIHLNPSEFTLEQKLCVGSYIAKNFFDEKQVIDNIYLDISNGHLLIIIDDDIISELIPTYVFYKDENGNVWYKVDYDDDTCEYKVEAIDVDDNGYYLDTRITWYMSNSEFDELERIEVEVDKVW